MAKLLAAAVIFFGLFMVYGGVTSLTRETPQCGSSTMHSADTCVELNRSTGHSTTRSVDEQRGENNSTGWGLLGFGIVVTAFGVLLVVVIIRMRRGWVPPQRQ